MLSAQALLCECYSLKIFPPIKREPETMRFGANHGPCITLLEWDDLRKVSECACPVFDLAGRHYDRSTRLNSFITSLKGGPAAPLTLKSSIQC